MEKKPPKFPAGMMQPSKPVVSRRRANMQEGQMPPAAAPMGVRKPRKPAGNPMNPMMGKNKPKRGMY